MSQERNQAFFDKTLNFLRKQGVAATDGSGDGPCRYRTPSGHMCAFGCHIPDDMYTPAMENITANQLLARYVQLQSLFDDVDFDLIQKLQDAHDQVLTVSMSKWEISMRTIANEYDLVYTPPGEAK